MSTVVSLDARRKKATPPEPLILPTNDIPAEVLAFNDYLYEWASLQGIDTASLDYKYGAASIAIILQGIVKKNDSKV